MTILVASLWVSKGCFVVLFYKVSLLASSSPTTDNYFVIYDENLGVSAIVLL